MKTNTFTRLFTTIVMFILVASLCFCTASATELETYDGEAVFMLLVVDPDSGEWTNLHSTLVYDPASEGFYLVTDSVVAELMKEGFEVMILGDDGYYEECQLLGSNRYLTFLNVPSALCGADAMVMGAGMETDLLVGYRGVEDGDYVGELEHLTTSLYDFTLTEGGYWVNDQGLELPVEFLGAPVFEDVDGGDCIGFLSMDANGTMVIIPYLQCSFPAQYAI